MIIRPLIALAALAALGSTAGAQIATLPSMLPTFAAYPAPAPSIWTGFHVGSEIFGGSRGGIGGAVSAGYDHEFSNNLVLGIDAKAGYSPSLFKNSLVKGYDFAATNVKVGYDMGRFMPYVTMGAVFASPNTRPNASYFGATDSVNNLFNSVSNMQTLTTLGAGFEYALTDKLHVGLEVSATHGSPFVMP